MCLINCFENKGRKGKVGHPATEWAVYQAITFVLCTFMSFYGDGGVVIGIDRKSDI